MRAKTELKAWAVRQRIEERRSLDEIRAATGMARSTLSLWLRPYPLTGEERAVRRVVNHRGGVSTTVPAEEPSKFYQMAARPERALTARDKGRIAETAVLFRLAVQGFAVYSCVFEGDKADFVVEVADEAEKSGRRLVKA